MNWEKEVKKKFTKAKCENILGTFYITDGDTVLGSGVSKDAAWADAYVNCC